MKSYRIKINCLFTYNFLFFLILLFLIIFSINVCKAQNYPATTLEVVNYARNLSFSIVDKSFRGTWVIAPEHLSKINENKGKMQKTFNSLAKVKIGSNQREVRKVLENPSENRNNGQIWIYGQKNEDGSYGRLTEVFFDEKQEYVTGIITFNEENIVENLSVNIGDSIDKVIDIYGEPVDEQDFIEDPDNKHYLGLHYLYPRSGIGFLIGQDKESKKLLVRGILVFGKN